MASPHSRALVTGPIHKERLNQGGYPFRGHTDFLGHLSGQKSITMLLANEIFRVALVSDHVSMTNLSRTITKQRVVETCGHAIDFATQRMGRKRPVIAVLGLNPHAGEGGLLGQEEASEISPALDVVRKAHPRVTVTGPWSADGFFATELTKAKLKRADVIVAMYHDQGLIPVKLVDFENCLNTTLGLPFIRTSVDHGTAFDIAKKNKANPSSMIYAIRKAYEYLGAPL
jgi:4-hydroxythreonine-4-phosphate dehydrogenase